MIKDQHKGRDLGKQQLRRVQIFKQTIAVPMLQILAPELHLESVPGGICFEVNNPKQHL